MKKIIVIGAGISGLTAAIYAKRSGFDVTLCEQHSISGGMCTSWKRKGYLFEGAVHWLTGSSPKTEIHQLWKDTGALGDNVNVINNDVFYSVEHDGKVVNIYRDLDKTIKHLMVISPNDARQLRRLASDVKAFSYMEMPVYDVKGVKAQNPKRMNLSSIIKMFPAFPKMGRLTKLSSGEYADQFKHPALRRLFRVLTNEYSALSLIATLSTLNMGDGGYPEGGSLAMVERMVKTFKDLGGNLMLKTKVKKVNIENGAVTGVALENEILAADAVIVTQETIAAVNQLFDIPLNENWLTEICENTKPAVCTFIGVGIKAEIKESPVPAWILDEPLTYAGRSESELSFYNYAKYKGYAPEGCSTLTTGFMGDTYDFWKKAKDEGRYEEEKHNLANQISKAICKKFNLPEEKIEVIDIATPLTYERFTGAFRGSWMGIAAPGDKMKSFPGDCKNVKGLYFAGHRLMSPGGLPVAVFSGRQAAQMVCRQFGAVFK